MYEMIAHAFLVLLQLFLRNFKLKCSDALVDEGALPCKRCEDRDDERNNSF